MLDLKRLAERVVLDMSQADLQTFAIECMEAELECLTPEQLAKAMTQDGYAVADFCKAILTAEDVHPIALDGDGAVFA